MEITRRKPLTARVALFCVGHHTYWNQYPGLLEELLGYHQVIKERLESRGVTVTDFGMVDNAESAYPMARAIKQGDFDVVFCNMATYATSSTWGVMLHELSAPIVLIALQPRRSFDFKSYTTHLQLANDQVPSVPEFMGVALRMGKRAPALILGSLYDDAAADAELAEWCRIAHVLHDLRGARIGQMGHTLEAMLDMHSDHTTFTGAFGMHIVQTEPDDVLRELRRAPAADVAAKTRHDRGVLRHARSRLRPAYPAPDRGRPRHRGARGGGARPLHRGESSWTAWPTTTRPSRVPRCASWSRTSSWATRSSAAAGLPDVRRERPEDVRGDADPGSPGHRRQLRRVSPHRLRAQTSCYVGHDGPHHLNIADGKPVLRSLLQYHGKPGSGAWSSSRSSTGPITMLGIGQTVRRPFQVRHWRGRVGAGTHPADRQHQHARLLQARSTDFRQALVPEGPTHHFALGVGHHARTIKKIGEALGIESVIIPE